MFHYSGQIPVQGHVNGGSSRRMTQLVMHNLSAYLYYLLSVFHKRPNWTCCAAVDGVRSLLYFGNKTFHFCKQKCNGTLPLITQVQKLSSLANEGELKTTESRKRKFSSECPSFAQWTGIVLQPVYRLWFVLFPLSRKLKLKVPQVEKGGK